MTTGPMVDTVTATTTGLSAGTWRPQPPRTRAAATATATGWLIRRAYVQGGLWGGPDQQYARLLRLHSVRTERG